MTCTYRPQLLWLVMGPLLGAFSGAVVGTLLVWGVGLVTATSLTWGDLWTGFASGLLLGGIWGGACGIAVGLVVGIPFTFLVGRHLPRDVARRRAHVLGAVLPPVAMLALVVVVLDARLTWPDEGEDLLILLPLAGSAVMGSRLAGWLAGMDDHAARPVS